ncbi:MAG: ornithine cyclodeaminase [Acidobacteriota bacterium]|nr:MAG: ornithine cyclodeaminase [Acidobacteriota bacterium]
MRIISHSDVSRAITMPEAIEAVRMAFIDLSVGGADVPVRQSIAPGGHSGATLVMPGYLAGTDALAVKLVSVRPENPARGKPLIYGIVLLIDAATGEPLAAIEGASLTALRTGAASGLATDLLAREDARTLALFGAGAQAETQLEAVCAVRPIEKAFIRARTSGSVVSFIDRMRGRCNAELIAAGPEAVREADIVCAATTSATPVFDGDDLRPGTHVNGVGSYTPGMQEVDFATLRRTGKIVVDSIPAALAEAGDLIRAIENGIISRQSIHAEIGEIAAGMKPGRTDDREITFFKSVGNAAQDVAVAALIYRNSIERGLGVEAEL